MKRIFSLCLFFAILFTVTAEHVTAAGVSLKAESQVLHTGWSDRWVDQRVLAADKSFESNEGVHLDVDKSLNGSNENRSEFGIPQPPDVPLIIVKPNGGERFEAGRDLIIYWLAPVNVRHFSLLYSPDNKATWTKVAMFFSLDNCINHNMFLTCRYVWTIPPQDGRKSRTFLRLIGYDFVYRAVAKDDTDGPFVIDVLRLVSPNGGEVLKVGDLYTINWETYALTRTVARVVLQYSTDGGKTWRNIKTFVGTNPGRYIWTVPNTPCNNCKVRVVLRDSAGISIASDVSDRTFTIRP